MTGHPILFTVDVESDWGGDETRGIEIALPRLLDLLEHHRAQATFFVVGELAGACRAHLRPGAPHEVGSHGLTHGLLTRMPLESVTREVEESKRVLEAHGYRVAGFRAPFLRAPRQLPDLLRQAGYGFDASGGSVLPSVANLRSRLPETASTVALPRLGPSTLRDGVTPFSLTWLRVYHPVGLWLSPRRPAVFCCHLHELLEGSTGWRRLPGPLRRLHARNTGERAWRILEAVLSATRGRCLSCRTWLESLEPGA